MANRCFLAKTTVAKIGENSVTIDDILVHDAYESDPTLHLALINMQLPDFPVAFGVIRSVAAPVYDQEMQAQIAAVKENRKISCVDELLRSGNTWEVEGTAASSNSDCQKAKNEYL